MLDELSKVFDKSTVSVISEIYGKKTVGVRETARKASLPVTTVYRIFRKLESAGILRKEKIASARVYAINTENKLYFVIDKLLQRRPPLEVFVDAVTKEKVDQVLLLDDGENVASIMVVGEIKSSKVNDITDMIKKEYNFSIKVFPLNQAQFESMAALNMTPVPKKILFKK